jgi:alginate O-acetyltransferase complex protein AlgI
MLFDTPVFAVFLVLVVSIYWRLGFNAQNRFLLAASYFFYGWWDWRFLLLMIASTLIDYWIALRIAAAESPIRRRMLLIASLVVNLSILGFFKYFNFFVDSFAQATHWMGMSIPVWVLRIILPPGISFYTFQEVAYIVDVYKGRIPPARSFTQYALFISLFPHLIAGPIQRPEHLLPQTQRPRHLDWERIFDGMMLIVEGFFRKCVIADNCGLIANAAFNGGFGKPSTLGTLLGMYAFAWQIYGDFSGYSSIARGCAQLLGFHFMVNFRQPYLAESPQDFWRRWHISLSTWLRDYLYIPLGGNRHGTWKTYKNLILTMLLGGLWHGANWTYVVWGGIHGGGLAVERVLTLDAPGPSAWESSRKPSWTGLWTRRLILFHFVCLAWVFFRAATLQGAWTMIEGLTVWRWHPAFPAAVEFLAFFSIPLFLLDLYLERTEDEYFLQSAPVLARVATAAAGFLILVLYGANQANAFIYFQF